MKRIMKRAFIAGITLAAALFTVSGCKDIFHSKEDIDYVNLILDTAHNGSVLAYDTAGKAKMKEKNYYKFRAERGVTYYISWSVEYSSEGDYKLSITTFWYDTGGVVMGEQSGEDGSKTPPSFVASRSGDVVVRATAPTRYYDERGNTVNYRIMVSTKSDNYVL